MIITLLIEERAALRIFRAPPPPVGGKLPPSLLSGPLSSQCAYQYLQIYFDRSRVVRRDILIYISNITTVAPQLKTGPLCAPRPVCFGVSFSKNESEKSPNSSEVTRKLHQFLKDTSQSADFVRQWSRQGSVDTAKLGCPQTPIPRTGNHQNFLAKNF